MVFSSLEFLFLYFPITLLLYFLIPPKFLKWRNVILLVMSLIFYGWGEPLYVFLMIFTIIIDYICGYYVDKYRETSPNVSKRILILAVVINLGILGFFKYCDFFITNLRMIPGLENLPLLNIGLPIGISFYTFQALSYVLDVYRLDAKVQKNIASFGAYVTLFPQLIAGPIVRYQDVDDMLRERDENATLFASGIRTLMAGMGKKIILANIAGSMWESYLAVPDGSRTVVGSFIGLLCYAFQIYFDFSAYSDMAIGLGKMVGFRFLENFNYPYISKSITEFWRRWHMSLSTWFREYVYFPLGGSRCSKLKNYRNLFIVWFLTGFWHGASWNYILWGLYYFIILVIEKAFMLKLLSKLPSFVRHLYTLILVLFGWLLFVFEDLSEGLKYLRTMVSFNSTFVSGTDVYDLIRNLLFFILLVIGCTPLPKKLFYKFYEKSQVFKLGAFVGTSVLLILCISYMVSSTYNPFLYFRF